MNSYLFYSSVRAMGRKPGFDQKKVENIVKVLVKYPEGIWVRKIAEEAALHPSTVTKYLEGILSPLIEDVSLAGRERPILRIVRLKTFVVERLQEGKTIQEILNLLKYFTTSE
jgi:DNA-binding IclR family transcriptional regulator